MNIHQVQKTIKQLQDTIEYYNSNSTQMFLQDLLHFSKDRDKIIDAKRIIREEIFNLDIQLDKLKQQKEQYDTNIFNIIKRKYINASCHVFEIERPYMKHNMNFKYFLIKINWINTKNKTISYSVKFLSESKRYIISTEDVVKSEYNKNIIFDRKKFGKIKAIKRSGVFKSFYEKYNRFQYIV